MTVGVQVGSIVDSIGAPSFLNAFFSTIVSVLEGGRRGTRFPAVTVAFYSGVLAADAVSDALAELRLVREELATFPPSDVVWDADDPDAEPPWGDEISSGITSLADYFVTDTGRDLFEVLFEAFDEAHSARMAVTITEF